MDVDKRARMDLLLQGASGSLGSSRGRVRRPEGRRRGRALQGWRGSHEGGVSGHSGGKEGRLLGLERMVLESALPGAEVFYFYFLLLLFSRLQYGF